MGALALFLVLAGGGAYAAFDPIGEDGDVDACYQKKSGDLDLLKGRKCGKKEKQVSWTQIGPQGGQGPQGETGAQGPKGDTGAPGSALAYAHVRANGTLDTARTTTNVQDIAVECSAFDATCPVTHAPFRTQCFKLSFTPQNAVANGDIADPGGSVPNDISIRIPARDFVGGSGGCPVGYTAASSTSYSADTGASQPGGFWILFN